MTYSQASRRPSVMRRAQNVGRYETANRGLGPIANILFLASIMSIMGLIYLTQVTRTSVFGFEVSALKSQKQDLIKSNENLRLEAARLQAIERIKASQVAGGLEENKDLTFAPGTEGAN